ncbi:MAG: T9SS type A sorting domain-containing protein [Flavobacteriaceae bacterium]
MNNFTRSSGNAYWHAITNLTCCSIGLKKAQWFKTFMVLALFVFSSTSMFAQNRTTFYEVCVEDRPEGLTEEQALALFPNMECDGELTVVKTEDLQGNDCGWVSIYTYTLYCDGEELANEKLIYEGGDLEAPKLEVPADVTVECDAIPEVGMPTATDNCDDDVEITYDGEVRIGDNDCSYVLQRTWTATDDCGLTHTLTQTITVLDTQAPELIKGAEVPTGETGLNLCFNERPEGPSAEEIKALFEDNCGDVIVEKEPVFKGTDCLWKGFINYYIMDSCGNEADTITLYYNGGDNEAPVFVDAPEDIEVDCIDQIPANYALQWTDNCSESDPKSKDIGVDDTSNLGEACEGGVMTRTWTVQDACGNEVSHTQTITVKPAPPVSFDELEDIEIKCEELDSFEPGQLYYSNGGSGACDISGYVQGVAEDFSDNCGTFTVTYTYSDTCNSIEHVQTVTVIDDVAPELTIPADETVECDAVPGMGEAYATDNCDTDVDVKYDGEVRTDGECTDSYTLTRTWTATDNCGNSTTLSQIITVVDTTAPELTIPADETVECDAVPGIGEASATDNCDTDVTVVFVDEKREDGDCADSYLLFRVWKATDNCGNYTIKTQQITVVDTTNPVIDGVNDDYTAECPEDLMWSDPTASDNCDMDVNLEYSDVEDLDDCGLGTITRTWTATDNCGNYSQASQTITIVDTTAPEIVGVGDDMTIECPELPEFSSPYATDACDGQPSLTYEDDDKRDDCGLGEVTRTWTATDCAGNTTTASQTITVQDTVAPVIEGVEDSYTVECPEEWSFSDPSVKDDCDAQASLEYMDDDKRDDCGLGEVTRTWTATDCAGNTSTASQTITIQDTTDPVITVPADVTVECDAIPALGEASATDNCDDDVHIKFAEERTELGDCDNSYTIFRIWIATDCAGNSVLGTQEITVVDTTAPMIHGVDDDAKIECPAEPMFSEPTATDNCDEDVTITFVDDDKRDECGLGEVTRTWTATDNCGNYSQASQTITVEDNEAPTIEGVEDDYTVECPEDLVWSDPSAKDTCDAEPELRYEESSNLDECGLGTVTRTWYATDCAGNMSSDTQTITIVDTTAPEIEGVEDDYTVECPEELVWSEPTAKDACDAEPGLDFEDTYNLDNCGLGTITRTWTATDCAGNMSSDSQTITIVDTTAPEIVGVEDDYTVECPDEWSFSNPYATDTCDSYPSLDYQDDDKRDDCGLGEITRTWTATDCAGNTSTASQTITIVDTTAPVINEVGEDFMVECPEDWSFSNPYATDACDSYPSLDYVDDDKTDECGLGEITRTWTATDCAGNTSTASQTVTIKDTVAPVIEGVGEDYRVECPDTPEFSEPTVKDDCDAEPSLTFEDDDKRDDCGLGEITRTWTATDCAGNTSTASQTITIYDETDPYFNEELPQDVTEECDAVTPAVTLTASDACDPEVLVDFKEETTEGDCPGNYTIVRTWTAADCAGNSIEHVQTVTVQDTTAPEEGDNFELPASVNEINGCQDDYLAPPMTEEEFAAMFTDNCSNVVVTLFSSPVGNDCGWSIIHIYTVADDCGNILGDYKVYYSGEDLTAPELVGVPADMMLECTDEIPAAADVTAIDTCDDDVKVHLDESTVNYECEGNYDIIRTWTATDDCGNSISATQTIEVRDNEAPELIGELPEGDNQIDACAPDTENELAGLGVLTADEFAQLYQDNCSGVVVNRVVNLDGDDCKWILWVRYDITDGCGNEAQSVKVWYHGGDMSAPVQTGLCTDEAMDIYTSDTGICPADATITYDSEISNAGGQVSVGGVTFGFNNLKPCFEDNCTAQDDLVFTVVGTDEGDDKACPRTMTITFDVSDACGNTYEGFVCTFVIIDDVAPTFDNYVDEVIYVECDEELPSYDVKASDNCDDNVDVEYSESECDQANHSHGQGCFLDCVMRTWTATDECGNTTTQVQYAVIIDNTAPTFENAPGLDPQNPINLGVNEFDYFNDPAWFDRWIEMLNTVKVDLVDNCTATRQAGWYNSNASGYWNNDYTELTWYGYLVFNASSFTDLNGIGDNVDDCGNPVQEEIVVYYYFTNPYPILYGPSNNICEVTIDTEGNVTETPCNNQAQANDTTGDSMVELDFTAFPVPFDREVSVKFNFEFDTDVTIEVHDTKGLLIMSETLKGVRKGSDTMRKLDLSKGADQLFYITVTTNQGSVTKKVVSSNIRRR